MSEYGPINPDIIPVTNHEAGHGFGAEDEIADVKGGIRQSEYDDGSAALVDAVATVVATVTLRTRGGKVRITADMVISETKSAQSNALHGHYIYCDGAAVRSNPIYRTVPVSGGVGFGDSSSALNYSHRPAAGRHTYELKALYIAGSTSGTPSGAGSITAEEVAL